jgi:hypothetical protein
MSDDMSLALWVWGIAFVISLTALILAIIHAIIVWRSGKQLERLYASAAAFVFSILVIGQSLGRLLGSS